MRTRADCTVRALVAVTGLDYAVAETVAAAAGRKLGQGFWPEHIVKQCARMGIRFRKLRVKRRRTLDRFIREYPQGRFYVQMTGHMFAVIDGAPSGVSRLGVLVEKAWLLTTPPIVKAVAPAPRVRKPIDTVALREARYERVCKRIAAWEKREQRAKNALKKLRRQRAYYERTLVPVVANATVH